MIISIASGKGGTGKTTVAVNLFLAAEEKASLLDCDVEEPNSAIFLDIKLTENHPATIAVPEVDKELCVNCGKCSEFCEYNAIAALKTEPLIFPELCHGCGGCALVCPEKAITETPRTIGSIESGNGNQRFFTRGKLNIGEPMAPPVIRQAKKNILPGILTLLDCPPGTSCPMITAVSGSDFAILVTEPTPFGMNDLELAVKTLMVLGIPFGVIINRADIGDDRVLKFCESENIPILMSIPNDRRIAEAYSNGKSIVDVLPEYREKFRNVLEKVKALA